MSCHVDAFVRSAHFLSYLCSYCLARPSRHRSSYEWKHEVERVLGGYVGNGMFIAAALALGFPVARIRGTPNAWIGLSHRAWGVDRQRLGSRGDGHG